MTLKILFTLLILNLLASNLFCQDVSEFKTKIDKAAQAKDTLAIARAWYKLGKFYEINEQLPNSNAAFKTALFFAESINSMFS